jgi:hypothetical protein
MEINAITKNPQQLVDAIVKALENDDLQTWTIVEESNENFYFTYLTKDKQCYKIIIIKTRVIITDEDNSKVKFIFTYLPHKPEPTKVDYGIIIGRFTEALIVHFHDRFKYLIIN